MKSLFRQLTLHQWVRWVIVSNKSMLVKSFALGLFSIISWPGIGYLLVRMCWGDTKVLNSSSKFGTKSQNIHLYIYILKMRGYFYWRVRFALRSEKAHNHYFQIMANLLVKVHVPAMQFFHMTKNIAVFSEIAWTNWLRDPQVLRYYRYCMTAGSAVSAPQSVLVH